jgi:hypothetical protein
VAVADVTCKASSGLVLAYVAERRTVEQELVDRNATARRAVETRAREQGEQASAVLETG